MGRGEKKKSIFYFIRAIDQPRQMLFIPLFFFCKLCSFKLKIYLSIFSRFMSMTQLISYSFLFFIILSPVLFSCIIFSLFLLSISVFHYFFFCLFSCTVGGVRSQLLFRVFFHRRSCSVSCSQIELMRRDGYRSYNGKRILQ